MIPWQELGRATIEGEALPLILARRGEEYAIRLGPHALMTNTLHGSEEVLAELALAPMAERSDVFVMIGGLGMGFTLAAALRVLGETARVLVVELVPEVIEWNRGPLAALAGEPLRDRRATAHVGDVAEEIRARDGRFDAILLDVDNGPNGLTRASNDWLYGAAGLQAAYRALRPNGVLGVWSVAPDRAFTRRLNEAGFVAREESVRARRTKGGRHTLWLATRPSGARGR